MAKQSDWLKRLYAKFEREKQEADAEESSEVPAEDGEAVESDEVSAESGDVPSEDLGDQDIGTDTIKAVTVEEYNEKFNVLATASSISRGVKKGLIVDASLVTSAIKKVVKELESKLGTKVEQVLAVVPSNNREILMGLFYSPLAVRESLKSGIFASALFEYAGFEVSPRYDEKRYDIVTCIKLENEKNLLKFCESVQKYSPIDSFVVPEPWNMPGYDHKVVMASGGFVSGSSIELSADAPLKEPFAVWFQGGTNFYLAKKALLSSSNGILMLNN